MGEQRTKAVHFEEIAFRDHKTSYPEPFASRVEGRKKRKLGDLFGLENFGVNITTLEPGAMSSIRHAHAIQDEFVFVLGGEVTLITDDGEEVLSSGMCVGFPAGTGNAHHFINKSSSDAVLMEIGDRSPGDSVVYPDDDLVARMQEDAWVFLRKDGTFY